MQEYSEGTVDKPVPAMRIAFHFAFPFRKRQMYRSNKQDPQQLKSLNRRDGVEKYTDSEDILISVLRKPLVYEVSFSLRPLVFCSSWERFIQMDLHVSSLGCSNLGEAL